MENGSEAPSGATRSGAQAEFRFEELTGALRSGEPEPAGAVIGLEGELEVEKGAALALEIDQRRQLRQETIAEVESQAIAIGQRLLLAAAVPEQPDDLLSPYAQLRWQQPAGECGTGGSLSHLPLPGYRWPPRRPRR